MIPRPRSPIEAMIDKACGFDPSNYQPDLVLECPVCGESKEADRADHDPVAASRISYPCPACRTEQNDFVEHFDKDGRALEL